MGPPVPTPDADPRRRWRALLVLVVALGLLVPASAWAPPGAGAQEEPDAPQDVRLHVSRLTGVVGPGAVPEGVTPPDQVLVRLLVEHRGDELLEDVEVLVETFGRLVTRTELHDALDFGNAGRPRVVERFDVRDGVVEPGDVAAVDAFVDVAALAEAGRTGVYPLKASLVRGTTVLDQVVTAVVHLDEAPANPLDAVVVWPIDTSPATGAAAVAALDREVAPGGRLDGLVAGLEAAPSSGIVAAVSGSLLQSLAQRTAAPDVPPSDLPGEELTAEQADARRAARNAERLLERLRSVLGTLTHDPVAGTYADADLTALLSAGTDLARLAGELAAEGPLRVASLGGRVPDPEAHHATTPLDPRALDLLPGDHLLLPWEQVVGPSLEADPDLPFPVRRLRSASGRLLTATVADPWLTAALADPPDGHGSLVAVQRVLAETALVQLEAPGIPDRPLLLLPPRDWDPGGRVARSLAPALVNAPWLRLGEASRHADAAGGFLQESEFVPGQHLPEDVVAGIGAARDELAGLLASLPDGVTTVGGTPADDLRDRLRRAGSHWFVDEPSRATAIVEDVRRAVEDAYGVVEVPTADAITLTGEQGRIPITVRRASGDPIEVEVEVRSRGTLSWPRGSVQRRLLAAGDTRTLSFDVTTRSRGDVPVEVVVRDASGSRVLADTTIRVRSTFVSGPALGITAGVVVLLLLVGRLRRQRGDGDPPSGPTSPDGASPDETGLTVVPGAGGGT